MEGINEIILNSMKESIPEIFKMIFDIFWQNDKCRELMLGTVIYFITYRVVGRIMESFANIDIWFGRIKGRILYFVVCQIVTHIMCSLAVYVPVGDVVSDFMRIVL